MTPINSRKYMDLDFTVPAGLTGHMLGILGETGARASPTLVSLISANC